jgi:hypothetical protein
MRHELLTKLLTRAGRIRRRREKPVFHFAFARASNIYNIWRRWIA